MRETHVVTCFLVRTGSRGHDEVLILRRSGRVRTYRGRWAVSAATWKARPGGCLRRGIRLVARFTRRQGSRLPTRS